MKIRKAAAFAIEKLSDEIDREFDGSHVSVTEERAYLAAIKALSEAFGLDNPILTEAEYAQRFPSLVEGLG